MSKTSVNTRAMIAHLEDLLTDAADEVVLFEEMDDVWQIDNDLFSLVVSLDSDRLEIRSFDVHGNTGLGRDLVEVINECADDYDLTACALNVRDEAAGFWTRMGYEESGTSGTYCRDLR